MAASSAPQKRTALLTSASNTGWMSVGDLLMACNTSEVAVCCSLREAAAERSIPVVLGGRNENGARALFVRGKQARSICQISHSLDSRFARRRWCLRSVLYDFDGAVVGARRISECTLGETHVAEHLGRQPRHLWLVGIDDQALVIWYLA